MLSPTIDLVLFIVVLISGITLLKGLDSVGRIVTYSLTMLLILASLTSCGPKPQDIDERAYHGVNEAFQPYLDEYIINKGYPLAYDISINFAPVDQVNGPKDKVVGLCTEWDNSKYRQITIDLEYWNSADINTRLALIYHELGHCDLDLDHDDTLKDDYRPLTLMHPNIASPWNSELSYYTLELFNR